jgi:hypothetical protein
MPSPIADFNALPNELILNIIKHTNDIPTTAESDVEREYSSDVEYEYLFEEFLVDANHRPPNVNNHLLNLSMVNHKLRSLVAPFLFRNLILRNTVESGTAIGLIARSGLTKHVRRLGFVGTSIVPIYDPKTRGTRELRDVELPATVQQVLSNLDCFPALEGVDIWLALKQDSESGLSDYDGGVFRFFVDNDIWPVLLDDVFLALTRNQPKAIKGLNLYNFIPILTRGHRRAEWHAFLGELSSFGMQLCADWDYVHNNWQFTDEVIDNLWKPLRNFIHLSIASGPQTILGPDDGRSIRSLLDLAHAPLPNLTLMAFDYIFVDDDLLKTLLAHTDTLRSVRMDHVFVPRFSRDSVGDYTHTTWAEFFTYLNDPLNPFSSLTDFEVLCTGDWNGIGMHTGRRQRAQDEERQRMLEQGTPELRYCLQNYHPWGYISEFDISEHEDPDCIMDPRKDRLAYDLFMEKVKSNRTKLGIV